MLTAAFIVVLLSLILLIWRRRRLRTAVSNEAGPALEPLRGALTLLLAGSLLLLAFSQLLYVSLQPPPPLLYLFMGGGLAGFLLAGHALTRQDVALWHNQFFSRSLAYLRLSSAQAVLLVLALCLAYLARLAAGDGIQAHRPALSALAWLLSILFVVAGTVHIKRPSPSLARREWLLMLLLLVVAFVLRAFWLERFPATLSGDEASAGLAAVQFRQGVANNLLGLGWFSFPAFYFAVQSSGIWLLGQTAAALRISSALAGALTVVGVYWLGRCLFNRLTGLLAASYLLAFHFHIHFSRIGLQNIWDGLFLAWVLAAVWHGWQHERRNSFVLAGLLLGLGQYFYVSMRVIPLLLGIWATVAFFRHRQRFRRLLPELFLSAYVALIVVLPLLLLFVAHPNEFNAPLQRVTIFDGWLEQEVIRTGESAPALVVAQIKETVLGFTHRPLRHWYNPGVPLLLPVPAVLFIAGVLWILYQFDLRSLLLLLPLVALVLMGGFSQDPPASQRFVLVTPVVALLVALPVSLAVEWLAPLWAGYRRWLVAASLLVMAAVMLGDLHYYFFEVYDDYTLGGYNTLTATRLADYLQEQEPPAQKVYFFGFPRMGYYSLSTVPYLAPQMVGEDVEAPLTSVPGWVLSRPTLFIFLPERLSDLAFVQAAFPGGGYEEIQIQDNGQASLLFAVYQTAP